MNFVIGTLPAGSIFLLFLLLHTLVWRSVEQKGVLLLWSLAGITFVGATGVMFFFGIAHGIPSLFASICLYSFLLIAYTRFYITIARTLTLRFLEELLLAQNKRMSEETFRAIYPPEHAFKIRLHLLEKHRWITHESGSYVPTEKCRIIGRGIGMLRSFYGIRRAG